MFSARLGRLPLAAIALALVGSLASTGGLAGCDHETAPGPGPGPGASPPASEPPGDTSPHQAAPGHPPGHQDDAAKTSLVDSNFSETYRIFLRRNLSMQEKTMLWATKYKDRWVRWTGMLVGFSPTGIKMKHLAQTMTFDVSVIINEPQRTNLKKILQPGKFYTYTARFDKFDDLFRTFYLDQGSVQNPSPAGTVGELVPRPPPLRVIPVEKSTGAAAPPESGPDSDGKD